MKQLLIVSGKALAAGTPKDLTGIGKGKIGFYHLDDDTAWLTAAASKNFAIALGYENANAFVIPEVDFSSLTLQKATYQAGTTFEAKVEIPADEDGNASPGAEYTVIIVKKGVVFHERNTWTATSLAKNNSTAEAIANDIAKQINASSETSGVTATVEDAIITITGSKIGEDYGVTLADELMGVAPLSITNAEPEQLGKAYMQDLASRCAAGKGFNYTAEDAHEMYPGYPEPIDAEKYTLYTLRFKVGRVAAKQRDEQVYQIVHIAIPEDNSTLLDTILGLDITPTPSVSDGD